MDQHTMVEQAYKNGYEKGLEDGQPKWIPVTERMPDRFDQFLCVVLRPIPGGKYVREMKVLWCDYDKNWSCEGLIVTHWKDTPCMPKEEIK